MKVNAAIASLAGLGLAAAAALIVDPVVAVEIPTESYVTSMSGAYKCKLSFNGSDRTVYTYTIEEIRVTRVAGEVLQNVIGGMVVYYLAPIMAVPITARALAGGYVVPVTRLYFAKAPCSDLRVTVPYGAGLPEI